MISVDREEWKVVCVEGEEFERSGRRVSLSKSGPSVAFCLCMQMKTLKRE